MLQQFVTQLPDDLSRLKKAIDEGSVTAIRSTAHNIKTTISFIGLETSLYPMLEALENLDNAYDAAFVSEQYNTLKTLCIKALEETLRLLL